MVAGRAGAHADDWRPDGHQSTWPVLGGSQHDTLRAAVLGSTATAANARGRTTAGASRVTQKFIKAVRDLVEASEAALDFMDQDRADTYYNPLPDEVEHFREAILIALIELEEQENDQTP